MKGWGPGLGRGCGGVGKGLGDRTEENTSNGESCQPISGILVRT